MSPILPNPPRLTPRSTIVFEGDSMTRRAVNPSLDTWAFLRMNNWHHSFSEIAEEWLLANLPELQIKVRHAAVGGSTMEAMTARYETQVQPCRPAWIVFTVGGNDCRKEVPLDRFEDQVRLYIERAARDSGARFLFAGGYLEMPGLEQASAEKVARSQPYFEIARRVVRETGGVACNMGQELQEKAAALHRSSSYHTFYSDGTHFNALANHVLAGLVLKHLGACTLMTIPT